MSISKTERSRNVASERFLDLWISLPHDMCRYSSERWEILVIIHKLWNFDACYNSLSKRSHFEYMTRRYSLSVYGWLKHDIIRKSMLIYLTREKRQSSFSVWSRYFFLLMFCADLDLSWRNVTERKLTKIVRNCLRQRLGSISIKQYKKRFTREINHTIWSILADTLKTD